VTGRSLRVRTVLATVAGVMFASLVIAVVAIIAVHNAAVSALDGTLIAQEESVRAQLSDLATGTLELPNASDPIELAPLNPADPVLVQVVNPAGVPLATTPGLARDVRICPSPLPGTTSVTRGDLSFPSLAGGFRQRASRFTVAGDEVVICTAISDGSVEQLRNAQLLVFAVTIPLVTLLAAWLVARGVGAALRTVAELTDEAERLTNLEQGRLGVPDTKDEIAHLASTLNEMLDRLHDQATTNRRFIADAGHELRTPLASLRVGLELAASGPADEALVRTDEAIDDVNRLANLVDELLILARADAGEPTSTKQTVNVTGMVSRVGAEQARTRPEISVSVLGSERLVFADERELSRAFRNVVANAIRHAHNSVEIEVGAGDPVAVTVIDDGDGLDPADVERVFERFVRLDEARSRDAGGSGLGLAIARAGVVRSGGSIVAEPGPGGRFVIYLPAAIA